MENFGEWLEQELENREWSRADLSRVSGVSEAQLSRIVNQSRNPGPDAATAIALALGIDPVIVFRKAELLPPGPTPESEPGFFEMWSLFRQLSPNGREALLRFGRHQADEEKNGRK